MEKKSGKKKSIKNKNSMKYIYEKCNHNKYSQIVDISGKFELKSNCKNLFINHKVIILITALVFLSLIIYAFKDTPLIILYILLFILALFLLALYNCTYKLSLDEKYLTFSMNLEKQIIKTDSLANVYISREKMHLFGFPIYNYNLNIIYMFNNEPLVITLPTVMLDRKQLKKVFTVIKTEKIKDDDEEEVNNKTRKIAIIAIISIIVIMLVISTIAGIFIYKSRI